jgi:hypothetical protein
MAACGSFLQRLFAPAAVNSSARVISESAREELRTAQGCEGEVADIDKWLEAR